MARKQVPGSNRDMASAMGESGSAAVLYPLSGIPPTIPGGGTEAAICTGLREFESDSWLERSEPFEYRRSVKRQRSDEELQQETLPPKKFLSEEVVASHLQQLNLASTNNDASSLSDTAILDSNTLPPSPSQSSTASSSLSSSSLLSVPLLSSSDCSSLLASVARCHPLNMKTVASCPHSLETAREGMMWEDDKTTESSRSDVPLSSSSLRVEPSLSGNQFSSEVDRTLSERGAVYEQRTSPTYNKRSASALEEEDDELDIGNGVGGRGGGCGWNREEELSLLIGPNAKRSKVDLRVTATTETMNVESLSTDFCPCPTSTDSNNSFHQCSSTDDINTMSYSTTLSTTTAVADSSTSTTRHDIDRECTCRRNSEDKRWESVVLEDGSDSSDGGSELVGPEKPLSVWLSPELQAISSSCGQSHDLLLPQFILEKIHKPKGMELVPWVGGPTVLAKVEEKLVGSGTESTHQILCTSLEESDKVQDYKSEEQEQNLNDISMEP